MKSWLLTISIIIGSVHFGMAQEQYGAVFSNYTPTTSVHYNPSSMLDAKTWIDIHILGVAGYGNNNLVSLNDNSYWNLYRTKGAGISEDDIVFHQNKKRYHAYGRGFASVLSAVWSQGDFAAGLSFNVFSYNAARGIPDYAALFMEHGVPEYDIQHNINYSMKNVYASSVNFGEIKGSFAYTFYKKHRDMLMGGVSLRKFIGLGGAAVNGYNMNFNVRNDSLMSVYELNTDAMYTPQPAMYWRAGWGIDLGFTYQKMLGECSSYYPNSKKMGCRSLPYQFKLAASILDIGRIKFDPDNVQFAGYDFSNFEWQHYTQVDVNEDNALQLFANEESDIDDGRVRKTNQISLPRSLFVQGDYNLWRSKVYASGAMMQSIPISREKFGVRRANSLMIGARYESKWFDLSIPISLYEYRYPQLGLNVRIAFLTLGTDKLLSIINKRGDIYGGDVYFHLKVPIYYHPKCKERLKSGRAIGNDYNSFSKKRNRRCEAYN